MEVSETQFEYQAYEVIENAKTKESESSSPAPPTGSLGVQRLKAAEALVLQKRLEEIRINLLISLQNKMKHCATPLQR